MGVLPCRRKGCDNIMCKYYMEDLGDYLCDECATEFLNMLKARNITSCKKKWLLKQLLKLCNTWKGQTFNMKTPKEVIVPEIIDDTIQYFEENKR